MKCCLSVRHWRAFIVLAIIAGSLSPISLRAQVSCSQVFHEPLSGETFKNKLSALAQLKIKLDTAQAANASSSTLDIRILEADYRRLSDELRNAALLSNEQFAESLKKEIYRLQKEQKNTEQETIDTQRRLVRTHHALPIYTLERSLPFDLPKNWRPIKTDLSVHGDIILKDSAGSLYAHNIRTNLTRPILTSEAALQAMVSRDGASLLVYTQTQKLLTIRLKDNRIEKSIELDTKGTILRTDNQDYGFIDVSPDGSKLLLAGLFISVFDINTGQRLFATRPHSMKNKARMISETEVVYTDDRAIYKHDITNNISVARGLGQTENVFDFDISSNGKFGIIYKYARRYKINFENMTISPAEEIFAAQVHRTTRIPGDATHILLKTKLDPTKDDLDNHAVIYDLANDVPVFDFDKRYPFDNSNWPFNYTSEFYFSQDRSEVAVLARDEDVGHIDIWKLK